MRLSCGRKNTWGRVGLQARADGPATVCVSKRPSVSIASSRRAGRDRERDFLSSVQIRPCGPPCRSGVFQPGRYRSQARTRSAQCRPRHIHDHIDARGHALAGLHERYLPGQITTRPVKGEAPTLDLVLAYHKANKSPILKLLLSRVGKFAGAP